jgi:hypothetical protein
LKKRVICNSSKVTIAGIAGDEDIIVKRIPRHSVPGTKERNQKRSFAGEASVSMKPATFPESFRGSKLEEQVELASGW